LCFVTCKHVLYDANSKSPTTSREVFYVAITRTRLYLARKLPGTVARATQKYNALDLMRPKSAHPHKITQRQPRLAHSRD